MKHILKVMIFLTLLSNTSCTQKTKEEKTDENTVNGEEMIDRLVEIIKNEGVILTFDELFSTTLLKDLPHIETTNFDSFIDEDDHESFDISSLNIEKIYPNYHTENYKAIAKYKLDLISFNFKTIVITILKGEHEMETSLINYDLKGNIIDYKVIAYDEIAESMSSIQSRISENRLTINHIFWTEKREVKQIEYEFREDGIIEKLNSIDLNKSISNFTLVQVALSQLKLQEIQVKTDLITSMILPSLNDETVIIIPEIKDEGEQYFELNSHIVIMNSKTGNLTHHYFENSTTNQWVSDAIMLNEISFDTSLYHVSEEKDAFGIFVKYIGSSKANPYTNTTLSLFIKSDKTLQKIITNFNVINYGGEWGTNCIGEFVNEEKSLKMRPEIFNNFFEIFVENKVTLTTYFEDENGECDSKDSITYKNLILRIDDELYK